MLMGIDLSNACGMRSLLRKSEKQERLREYPMAYSSDFFANVPGEREIFAGCVFPINRQAKAQISKSLMNLLDTSIEMPSAIAPELTILHSVVATKPISDVINRAPFVPGSPELGSKVDLVDQEWLSRHLVNQAARMPGWLSDFDQRIAELREVAAEEATPFSESSAEAARRFCAHYGRSIRPSVFLVGNGNIRLVWENDDGEQVGLQFRADIEKVQCVLFKQREDGMSTITAMETNAGLIDLLIGSGVLHLLGKR